MKIKKSDLLNMIQEQNEVIAKLIRQVNCHHEDIIRLESVIEPEPQLVAIRSKRDIAKELTEVDLSSELTGSDLCRAMLARGDKYVLCIVSPYRDAIDNGSVILPKVVTKFHEYGFIATDGKWAYAVPINNQGEPLTAAEAGL